MQNSPTAAYLRDCSLHERMMLASLVKCIKREGVEEIKWGEVSSFFPFSLQPLQLCTDCKHQVQHQHLLYTHVLTSDDDPKRKPTSAELAMVLDSLVASRALLVEDGSGIAKKPEGERKVLLNLEQNEVERVLSDLGGPRWKNVLCS
jgi:origin recognition complex subunit 1